MDQETRLKASRQQQYRLRYRASFLDEINDFAADDQSRDEVQMH